MIFFLIIYPLLGWCNPFDINRLKAIRTELSTPPPSSEEPNPPAPVATKLGIYRPRFSTPTEMKSLIQELFPNVLVGIEVRSRSLALSGEDPDYSLAWRLMKKLDTERPQIDIEVSIIEVAGSYTDIRQAWILQLSDPIVFKPNLNPLSVIPTQELQGLLSFVRTQATTKVWSQPRLTTIENRKARFKMGDRVPYLTTVVTNTTATTQVGHAETGVEIEVTPWLGEGGVGLDTLVQLNHIKLFRELSGELYPVVSSRMIQNEVVVPLGFSLVIAGFLDQQTQGNQGGIPWISDLPIVGDLMKSQRMNTVTTDVLIAITPRINQKTNKEALR